MNHFLKTLLILSSTIAFFSCSDDFVNEKLTISGVATSAIVISPEWEADDYEFKCEGVKEAGFTITSQPEWLILDSSSGQITDSIATVHGSAKVAPLFSKPGVYADQMLVTVNDQQVAVPVYYINEGNPSVVVERTFNITYANFNNQLQISNSGEGVLLWDIVSMPDWLTVDMSLFNPETLLLGNGAIASLPFSFNLQAAVQNNLEGTLVLKTNDKNNPLVEIAFSANLGNPNLSFYEKEISFGTTETTKTTYIYNNGSGLLVWNIEGLPDWLSVSTAGGTVKPYGEVPYITFLCNRTNLQPGLNSATIYLKSNDADQPSVVITVSVRLPGANANTKTLEGNIIEATFDKTTNILYYVTDQPNKLVAYDVTARKVVHEVALSKAPTCLAMDDDFKKALVGHGGLISIVDLTGFQVSKTYELTTSVFDVEWATGDWFCYTDFNSASSNLLWINSSTSETYQTPQTPINYSLRTAVLKKIPHQPYIIACRRNVSPTGIFVFDLNTKALKSYTHTSIDNTWFFNQGELMVTGTSSIARTSVLTEASGGQYDDLPSIGQLKTETFANATWWVDYCEANHSFWTLFSYYTTNYYPPVKEAIYQFDDNDYKLVKIYTYDYLYQPDIQKNAYEVEARYVFSNSAGTELTVLRKGTYNTSWSVEFIAVQ